MFDIAWGEFVVIGAVALIVIGPKELPSVLRSVGQWTTKIRRMAAEFQSQFQEALREAEMADLKKEVEGLNDAAKGVANFDPSQWHLKDEAAKGVETDSALAVFGDGIATPSSAAVTADGYAPPAPPGDTPEAPLGEMPSGEGTPAPVGMSEASSGTGPPAADAATEPHSAGPASSSASAAPPAAEERGRA